MGGRGSIDIIRLYDKQVTLLQTHFLNKQVTSSRHAAVVKADDWCTPLDLVRANANELPTDEEYKYKVKRQWSLKALHGRHPHELSQQYVDKEASNKLLRVTRYNIQGVSEMGGHVSETCYMAHPRKQKLIEL